MSPCARLFQHAQLDSRSIEYFNVIRALRWLGMKKGVCEGQTGHLSTLTFHAFANTFISTLTLHSTSAFAKD